MAALCCLVLMTRCSNGERSESVGGRGFPLPLVEHICLVCSEATQRHVFSPITETRLSSVFKSESVQRDSQARERRALRYS